MKKLFVILSFIGLGLLFVPEVSAQSLFEEDTTVKDGLYDENETDYGVLITDLDAGDYIVFRNNRRQYSLGKARCH